MSAHKRRRILGFERLERKASPCSLLLLVANADEPLADELPCEVRRDQDLAISFWKHEISTSDLLAFIEQHTSDATRDRPVQTPTCSQSEAADSMMQLNDADLRNMIVFSAQELAATDSTLD